LRPDQDECQEGRGEGHKFKEVKAVKARKSRTAKSQKGRKAKRQKGQKAEMTVKEKAADRQAGVRKSSKWA
jgi:hypothetical protein